MSSSYADTYTEKLRVLQGSHDDDRAMELLVGGNFEAQGRLEKALLTSLGLLPHHSVVDVGCGSGRLAFALRDDHHGPYVGTDILAGALDYARRKVNRPDWEFVATNESVIPVPARSADFICFFSVFTHLRDEDCYRFLIEAKRAAKPGGLIVVSFLDFEIGCHWPIFENSLKDHGSNAVLNRFHARNTLETWARRLGLMIDKWLDGSVPTVPLPAPIMFDDGRVQDSVAEFGQSVCVLRVPVTEQAHGAQSESPPVLQPAPTIIPADGALFNAAVRGEVGTGDRALIAGFSLEGNPRRILVRGIGPSLTRFGVGPPCSAPKFEILKASGEVLATSVTFAALSQEGRYFYCRAFQDVGAFGLEPDAGDAVLIITLPKGAYSVRVWSTAAAGIALLEIYALSVMQFSPAHVGRAIGVPVK